MIRLEVWFNNGLFRAFPKVKPETIQNKEGFLVFIFGECSNQANINLSNVNFIEQMNDVD